MDWWDIVKDIYLGKYLCKDPYHVSVDKLYKKSYQEVYGIPNNAI